MMPTEELVMLAERPPTPQRRRPELNGREDYLNRYPRITGHIICDSLGYATPMCAAAILKDGAEGQPNYCEWVLCCHKGNAREVVQRAIKGRHYHSGYMAEYAQAKALVNHVRAQGESPTAFASWM